MEVDDHTSFADRKLLAAIVDAAPRDPEHLADLIYGYYQDKDRADRTPRSMLYIHLGMLIGAWPRRDR